MSHIAVAHEPLLAADPVRVADDAACEALLRCWIRETGAEVPAGGPLRLPFPAAGMRVEARVLYRSACGHHRLGTPRRPGGEISPAELARAIAVEAWARGLAPPGAHDRLAALVDESAARVADHVAVRRRSLDAPGQPHFLAAEQALLLGHPFHPTPKSREGSPADLAELSPELRGSFRLHWMAVRPALLAGGSAGAPPDLRVPADMVPIPVHPWQARDLAARPAVRDLLDAGMVADLGRAGDLWYPTSSLRTVWRPGAVHQLKLSLGMRVTNSRRENLRAELELGVQAHRLMAAGLGAALALEHPRFRVQTDPAWLGVDVPGARDGGFEVALRRNGIGSATRVACLAGLTAERPDRPASLLGEILSDLASALRRPRDEVAEGWFSRYLDAALAPLLWLRATAGVALEAHQQNTLVALDPMGWPAGAWYRDSQGWYVAAAKAGAVRRLLPGFGDGVEAIFDDALVDERLEYYLGVNNVLGLIGAMGAQGLADEEALLRRLRSALLGLRRRLRPAPALIESLLESPTLACKANLLHALDGKDELVGSVAAQSVYVRIANPLAEVG
jgi:siderophore synthetase component